MTGATSTRACRVWTTKVKAAHMRLCYSRMQLVQIFPRESQEMVFEAHERAFRFFGGVCRADQHTA